MFGLMQNLSAMIVTLVTVPFIIILTVINLVFLRSARKAGSSKNWPTTSGHVLSANVSSYRRRNSNGTHSTIYEPKVVYQYTAEGQQYQSSQLSYSMVSGMSAAGWAEGVAARYQPGSSVQVYYNPSKPSDAVLEHSGGGFNRILVLILGAVELFLIVLLVLAWTGRLG